MTTKELKENKPKYPETTTGTHCMGEGWTVCCPNKHLLYDRYIQTKQVINCLLYTSPSPRDRTRSRMPSSA